MKKIFGFLQNGWTAFIGYIFFGSTFFLSMKFGFGATKIIFALSLSVVCLVIWNLLSKWTVEKQGLLIATGGGALMGLISSGAIILYHYRYIELATGNYVVGYSIFLGAVIVCWGLFGEWVLNHIKKYRRENGHVRN